MRDLEEEMDEATARDFVGRIAANLTNTSDELIEALVNMLRVSGVTGVLNLLHTMIAEETAVAQPAVAQPAALAITPNPAGAPSTARPRAWRAVARIAETPGTGMNRGSTTTGRASLSAIR